MQKESRILIAGIETFFGKALFKRLQKEGYENIQGTGLSEEALGDSYTVDRFFSENRPEYVFLVGGKSGGIHANQRYPADMMHHNLLVAAYVIHLSYKYQVKKLLYLASSCCYPRDCPQPMAPSFLLRGPLEPTNEPYALAKIAGLKLCEAYRLQYGCNFIAAIPANAFGPGDDFRLEESHVIPALIRKIHKGKREELKKVEIWGTGKPIREFIFIDDLADACYFLMLNYDGREPINIGSGEWISIKKLAYMVKEIVGYKGELVFNTRMPDGMPRKILDSSVLQQMGWQPKTSIRSGLEMTYDWYLKSGMASCV